jgi:hypothetical protein
VIYADFIAKHSPHLVGTEFEDTCTMNHERCRFRFNGNDGMICLKCGCFRMRKRREDTYSVGLFRSLP